MKNIFKTILTVPLTLSFLLMGTACEYEVTKRTKKGGQTDDSDVVENWVAVEKSVFEYNDLENTSTMIRYIWDMSSNSWINDYRSETQSNDKGDWFQVTEYHWDELTGEWICDYRYIDDLENDTHIYYYWDTTLNDWRISSRQVTIYDGDYWIREEMYSWSDDINDWVLSGIGTYGWNDRGATSKIEWSYYNDYNNKWENRDKIEHDYSEDWKIWTTTYFHWRNDSWVASGKTIEEFNDFEATSSMTDFTWLEESNDWKETGKRVFEYNNDEKLYVYLFNEKSALIAENGFIEPNYEIEGSLNKINEITVPASSFVVISNKVL